jgi:hypothetical protein
MKKHVQTTALISGALTTGIAQAGNHAEARVWANNQAVSEGTVTAKKVNAEDGGMKTGAFEYTFGAKEDGPIKKDGKLVMTTITAQ